MTSHLEAIIALGREAASADPLAAVVIAERLETEARLHRDETVAEARAQGVPWSAIGEVLGITRQAAFKRFGSTNQGERLMSMPTIDLNARTEFVFESLARGEYDAVRSLMTYGCSRALTRKKLSTVWEQVVADSGRLESLSGTVLQTADGGNVVTQLINQVMSGGLTGQTQLNHEAGEWIGRVAYNGSGKITGMLIVHPMQAQNLPF